MTGTIDVTGEVSEIVNEPVATAERFFIIVSVRCTLILHYDHTFGLKYMGNSSWNYERLKDKILYNLYTNNVVTLLVNHVSPSL